MKKKYLYTVEFIELVFPIRAVVFRLFQKTVILSPSPVGSRLTYTQL